MIDRDDLRTHLQWFLVGSIHWHFVEAACDAIELVAAGRDDTLVVTPWRELLTSIDMVEVPFGEPVGARELVAGWCLEEFVERAVGEL